MEQKILEAAVLGTLAFKECRTRVPAHDKKLMDMLTNIKIGDGAVRILNTWLDNYDLASLNSEKEER